MNLTKPVKQEYFSDNSVSLPGILGQSGPVGFEPGMFNKTKDSDIKQKLDPSAKVNLIITNKYCILICFFLNYRLNLDNCIICKFLQYLKNQIKKIIFCLKFVDYYSRKRRRKTRRNISINTNINTNINIWKIRRRKILKTRIRWRWKKKHLVQLVPVQVQHLANHKFSETTHTLDNHHK